MRNAIHTTPKLPHQRKAAMKNAIALLALLFSASISLFGSHYLGFSVTYEQRGGDTLRVHQYDYIDCNLTVINPFWLTSVTNSFLCGSPSSGPIVAFPVVEVTPICPSVQTTCSGSSVPIYGIWEAHQYRDYDFAGLVCPEYEFTYSHCCRSPNVNNLNSSTPAIYGKAKVTQLGYTSTNSSPVWRDQAPRFIFNASTADNAYDLGADDPDGDSLVYTLVAAETPTGPAAYNPGYSPTSPLGPTFNVSLDSQTGFLQIQSNPGSFVNCVIVVLAEEYRNGAKLGEIRKDFFVTSFNFPQGAPVNPPTVTGVVGITGGYLFGDTAVIPVGTTSCIDIQSDDLDPGDISRIRGYYFDDASPYYLAYPNNTPANNVYGEDPVARFCISPLAKGAYDYYISAKDSTCATVAIDIAKFHLIAGDTAKVWPGDANNDLVANNVDLLALGLSFGNTGPQRPSASNNWVGQPAMPWQDTISGGIDQKYQDCNGSGQVDADDTLAIVLNYGLTHMKTGAANGGPNDPTLRLAFPMDSFQVGDTVHVPIYLGDSSVMAQNVYGIAFTVNYDQTLVDTGSFSIDFNGNWMGAAPNELSLSYDLWAQGQCDAAYVRTDLQVVSGMGQIATASFVIIDNIDGKRQTLISDTLYLDFSAVTLIGLDGMAYPVNTMGDEAIVWESILDQGAAPRSSEVLVFPNPAQNLVRIRNVSASMLGLEVVDMQGRSILLDESEATEYRLQTAAFPRGIYFLRIRTAEGRLTKKLLLD